MLKFLIIFQLCPLVNGMPFPWVCLPPGLSMLCVLFWCSLSHLPHWLLFLKKKSPITVRAGGLTLTVPVVRLAAKLMENLPPLLTNLSEVTGLIGSP